MKIRRIYQFLLSVLLAALFDACAYALEEPTLDARNALLVDVTADRVLYGYKEKEKLTPPASPR